MIGKRAYGHAEMIQRYRSYICQAAASVAGSGEIGAIRPDSRQTALGFSESRAGARLKAHLTRS